MNSEDIIKMSKKTGIDVKIKSWGNASAHIQIKGKLLVNYYPCSKNKTAYIAGTKYSKHNVSLEDAFNMSNVAPDSTCEKEKRKNAYRKEKMLIVKKKCLFYLKNIGAFGVRNFLHQKQRHWSI